MKVKWLGHASFLITSDKGTRIITDPYAPNERLMYGEIKETADVVTVSHDHFDHNNVSAVGGKAQVYRGPAPAEIKGVKFSGVATYHDDKQGKERGNNVIVCMEIDGIRLCHLGDLGHSLSDAEAAQVGKVDVLLSPVGGFYTITADVATEVSSKLKPRVIIPMHFKNDKCAFPITGVDDFLKGKKKVTREDSSEVEFKPNKLPSTPQIIVLKSAL
jgi:L-ascorbate metabolism protein UlaG (beta-lactamase superfamily)